MRLQQKLTLYLIPAVLLPLLLISSLVIMSLRHDYMISTRYEMQQRMTVGGKAVKQKLQYIESTLNETARNDIWQPYLMGPPTQLTSLMVPQQAESMLESYLESYPQVFQISLHHQDGRILLSKARADMLAYGRLDQVHLHHLSDGFSFHFGEQGERNHFHLTWPIANEQGDEIGFLQILLDPGFFDHELVALAASEREFKLLLVRNDGRVVSQGGAEIATFPMSVFAKHFVYSLQSNSPTELNGVEYYIDSREILNNFYLVGLWPASNFRNKISHVLQSSVVASLGALLLLLLLINSVLRRSIIEPVSKLSHAVDRVAKGDLKFRSTAKGQDELAELERGFESMVRHLDHSNSQLMKLVYRDSLTGLPNKTYIEESLLRAFNFARRHNTKMAVLSIDLSGLKGINDKFGHEFGDRVLAETAQRLDNCLRAEDQLAIYSRDDMQLARIRGDEFLMLLQGLSRPEEAATVARRIVTNLAKPFEFESENLRVGVNIGIAVYPGDGEDIQQLMQHAFSALYHCKKQGGNQFLFYDDELSHVSHRRMDILTELSQALPNQEMHLNYQPIFTAEPVPRMKGVEALLRWENARLGFISPAEFVPLAEQSGMMMLIGKWVLEQACIQAKAWHEQGLDWIVNVNVSMKQLQQDNIESVVTSLLNKYQLPPKLLCLEFTETAMGDIDNEQLQQIERLRAKGLRCALDDFGTGHSSLARLRALPVDIVKIDRCFVGEMLADEKVQQITRAMIALAKSLDLQIVAEGVETEAQQQSLIEQGVEHLQGYKLGKPMSVSELEHRYGHLEAAERVG